jgi:hypothetical protein
MDAANPTNKVTLHFDKATSDFDQPEAPLESNFDDKSGKARKTGPVNFAIDGDDLTGWGIDAGPGRRNQDRKAVFECATNAGFAGGTILLFQLVQNHGGWNSDDHMNNNLGRFRISACTNSGPIVADPLPKRVRDIFAIAPANRTDSQKAVIFSYWRTMAPEFKESTKKSKRFGSSGQLVRRH